MANNSGGRELSGRTEELSTLIGLLDRLQNDGATCCIVTGDAGMGKTILTRKLGQIARTRGYLTLEGRAQEYDRSHAYSTLKDTLSSVQEADLAAESAKYLKLVGQAIAEPHFSPVESSPNAPAEQSALARLTQFLRSATVEQPCVLIIDDAHASDDETLQTLSLAFRYLSVRPILLACAVRSDKWFAGSGFATTIGRLTEQSQHSIIELSALDGLALERLVQEVTGATPDSHLLAYIQRQSAGNPLFAKEALLSLQAQGALRISGETVLLPEAPPNIKVSRRGALLQRIFRQDQHCLELARLLSAFGEVHLDQISLIADLTGFTQPFLESAFDSLVEGGILVLGARNVYQFAHPLMAEVLYEDLGPTKRRRIHYAIASRLPADAPQVGRTRRATHLVESAEIGDLAAINAAIEVAEMIRHSAPLSAAVWYERALNLVGPTDPDKAVSTLAARALALWKGARPELAIPDGLQALPGLPPGALRDRTLAVIVNAMYATSRLDEALELLDGMTVNANLSIPFCSLRAGILAQVGRPPETIEALHEITKVVEERGNSTDVVTFTHLGQAAGTLGVWEEAEEWIHRLTDIGSDGSDQYSSEMRVGALESAAYLLSEAGFVMRSSNAIAEAFTVATGPLRNSGGQTEHHQIINYFFRGEWTRALETLRTTSVRLEFSGMTAILGRLQLIEGEILLGQARYAEAGQLLSTFPKFSTDDRISCEREILRSRIEFGHGQFDSALEGLKSQLTPLNNRGWLRTEARILEALFETYLGLQDFASARVAGDRLRDLAEHADIPRFRWTADLAAIVLNDDVALAEKLIREADSEGVGFILARAEFAMGVAKGNDPDPLRRALIRFDAMGARSWRERVLLHLNTAPISPVVESTDPRYLGLTDVERRLVNLVRDGLNNREIADELHYSRKTIEAYLSRLYRKFECHSRVGLIVALEEDGG